MNVGSVFVLNGLPHTSRLEVLESEAAVPGLSGFWIFFNEFLTNIEIDLNIFDQTWKSNISYT